MLRLNQLKLVHDNPQANVKVWKCIDDATGQLVALKRKGFRSVEEAGKALQEARIQRDLVHPCICKLLSFYQVREGDCVYNYLGTEWMDKDLFYDIANRDKNNFPWKEEELWTFFRGLTDALALAQKHNTSHRDIKPQHIFINSASEIKIGGFGSAKEGVATEAHTLVGTSYFLSPILRQALLTGMHTQVAHNLYKSDVFSLGMTFLFMAVLKPPIAAGSDVSEATTFSFLKSLPYSGTLKDMLAWMLATEESNRPDFLQLNAWLNPTSSGMQLTPYEETTPIERRCPTCFVVFTRPTPAWAALTGGVPDYCSIDCYKLMRAMSMEQEAFLAEIPPPDEIGVFHPGFCTYCKAHRIDLWLFDCGHGVCSLECGRALIINTTSLLRTQAICPQCQVPLSREVLLNFFEIEECYNVCYYNVSALRCDKCQEQAEMRYFACTHSYCTKCYLRNIEETGGHFVCPVPGCQAPYIRCYSINSD